MYEDDYDKRSSQRLSYISSPSAETISIIPPSHAGVESPSTAQSLRVQNHNHDRQTNGQSRPSSGNNSPTSPNTHPSPGSADTATTSFPLNDIDYESDPAAVAQELNNLAAIRRMSMDVAATGDPDLPSYSSNFPVPSSPSADENDTSRLFWVPARLHPELAPKEFKSFLESKADHIKRKSGDFSSLSPERQGSNAGLRRKRSMLSKQIDNSHGYKDGAERLERKRSEAKQGSQSPNLQQLEDLVDHSRKGRTPSASSLLEGIQNLSLSADDDIPILPPAPPGNSLRRSTRTQYRKAGSLKKGDKLPYSKRIARTSETNGGTAPALPVGEQPILGLTRVSTDPTPSRTRAQAAVDATQPATPEDGPNTARDTPSQHPHSSPERLDDSSSGGPGDRTSAPPQTRQWHSRISSNGRSTLNTPATEQKIPEIIETPPSESYNPSLSSSVPGSSVAGRGSTNDQSTTLPAKASHNHDHSSNKRVLHGRGHAKDTTSTLSDFASSPQPLPGNTTRTDSLSFIPTLPEERKSEERKPETKKSKDKKDSEGGRKSSWHWLLGSEEKDKEKKKDKDGDAKKIKAKIVDKVHETANVLPSSGDHNSRGRESSTFDRLDPKLEEERRKDHVRRTSGDSKKEKESGLFSSLFGGGRKKSGESHHKKSSSRTLSPDPPVRELKPDIDYPWTRFSILEERAIYRMAHIKLANPRRALYSQVLLSNFMYSYLAKVQQMHPLMLASSAAQRHQKRDQPDEYSQYQRYQESQDQYNDNSYDDSQMYEYNDDPHDHYRPQSRGSKHGYENGNVYGTGQYQYGNSAYHDDGQLDDDDDDMW
ncbi:hypothetical protein HFD88_008642 [Aspergillus terreus]|nr:hypothetical protein HFD88_008642 [Aspergillus terreus]